VLWSSGEAGAGQGLIVKTGGVQAIYLDFDRFLYSNFPKAILFILAATYILLLIMFRSVLLPLKAILMNVISVSASYGVLVFIFQWGNFKNILNFSSNGFIDSLIPSCCSACCSASRWTTRSSCSAANCWANGTGGSLSKSHDQHPEPASEHASHHPHTLKNVFRQHT